MKTYNDLILELNKYEKEGAKKARAFFIKDLGHKKYKELGLNKKSSLKAFEKAAEDQRSNIKNPYVSPRRESENVIGAFQDTEPGQKGRGNRVDPETGKVSRYNPTQARHKEMRGLSKSKAANIQKIVRRSGADQQGYSLDMVHKNLGGSQNRRIYQKAFSGTELEKVAGDLDMFPKTRTTGAPTTVNIPKGKIPEPPKVNPPSTFKPPKGSVGAMKSTVKPKTFQKVLKTLSKVKNKKVAAGALAVGGAVAGIQALRNRKK